MIIKTKKNGKEVYYCSIDSLLHRETSIIGFLQLPSPTCDPTTAKDLRRTRARAFQYSSSGLSQTARTSFFFALESLDQECETHTPLKHFPPLCKFAFFQQLQQFASHNGSLAPDFTNSSIEIPPT